MKEKRSYLDNIIYRMWEVYNKYSIKGVTIISKEMFEFEMNQLRNEFVISEESE